MFVKVYVCEWLFSYLYLDCSDLIVATMMVVMMVMVVVVMLLVMNVWFLGRVNHLSFMNF